MSGEAERERGARIEAKIRLAKEKLKEARAELARQEAELDRAERTVRAIERTVRATGHARIGHAQRAPTEGARAILPFRKAR